MCLKIGNTPKWWVSFSLQTNPQKGTTKRHTHLSTGQNEITRNRTAEFWSLLPFTRASHSGCQVFFQTHTHMSTSSLRQCVCCFIGVCRKIGVRSQSSRPSQESTPKVRQAPSSSSPGTRRSSCQRPERRAHESGTPGPGKK